MTFLPIVGRELAVAARRRATFRTRTTVAIITSLVAGFLILFSNASSARAGGGFFGALTALAFIFCLLEGTRTSADTISEEKREGTLGLLFLTDLRGHDVVLGKLVAMSVRSFQGLFAFFPVLSAALILGGVTAGEFWRMVAVLSNALFVALAIGIWISTLSREAHRALFATFVCLVVVTGMPVILNWAGIGIWNRGWSSWLSLSPASAFMMAGDLTYAGNPAAFWMSLVSSHVFGWIWLAASMFVVPRVWQDRAVAPVARRLNATHTVSAEDANRASLRAELLDVNPILWLASRRTGERRLLWLIAGVLTAVAISLSVFAVALGIEPAVRGIATGLTIFLGFILKIWLASQASSTLAEARRNGTIELLLATPLKVDDVMHGQWLALKRMFFWPAMAVVGVNVASFLGTALLQSWRQEPGLMVWAPVMGMSVFEIITFIVDLIAVAWFGMWMGLSSGKAGVAFGKTVLFGVIVPAVIFCIPNVLIDLVLISWSRTKLQFEFRRMASEQSGSELVWPAAGRRELRPPPLQPPQIR